MTTTVDTNVLVYASDTGAPEHARAGALLEHLAAGPDLVVLCAHWGFEYEHWPARTQRAHALKLVELGVDIIVGSSPHVLQPVELVAIDGADPSCPLQAHRGGRPRFAVIAWSLGNFVSDMAASWKPGDPASRLRTRDGMILTVGIRRDGERAVLDRIRVIPTFTENTTRTAPPGMLRPILARTGPWSARVAEIGAIVGAKAPAVGQRVKHAQRELAAMIERDSKRERKS